MGCIQKKRSSNIARLDVMSLQSRHLSFCSKREYDVAMRSTTAGIDFQALFKQNVIEDLIRNRESREARSRSCKKNKLSLLMKKAQKLKNTNQRINNIRVSASAGGSPRAMIIKKMTLTDVNY